MLIDRPHIADKLTDFFLSALVPAHLHVLQWCPGDSATASCLKRRSASLGICASWPCPRTPVPPFASTVCGCTVCRSGGVWVKLQRSARCVLAYGSG